MNKVALLIGVNNYQPDLGLQMPRQGIEAFYEALKQANPAFQACLLRDRPLAELQETIELIFLKRQPEDVVLLVLTGYAIETGNNLYFLMPDSNADANDNVLISTTLSTDFLRAVMRRSPAQRQIVILDCILRRQLKDTITNETFIDLRSLLGQTDFSLEPAPQRLILTATTTTHHSPPARHLPELWGYLDYLAEGLQRGFADANNDGIVTIEELHEYACHKLKIAAPALRPTLFGSNELTRLPLSKLQTSQLTLDYAKFVGQQLQGLAEVDAERRRLTNRTFLEVIQRIFELSSQQADQIESELLRPFWEYHQRRRQYQRHLSAVTAQSQPEAIAGAQQAIQSLRQALYLTEENTATIDIAPYVEEQQAQRVIHLEKLARYEQAFLAALSRQYPLAEGDREGLLQLQTVLALPNDEVQTAEQRIQKAINLEPQYPPQQASVAPPPIEYRVEEPLVDVPPTIEPPAASPNLERLLEHMERTTQAGMPQQNVVVQVAPEVAPQPDPTMLQTPVIEREPVVAVERSSSERRPDSRPFILEWLLPLLLLGTLAGAAAAAFAPGLFRGLPLQSASTNPNTTANAITDAKQAFELGLSKTREQAYTDAIAAYNRAIELNPNLAAAYINRGIVEARLGDLTSAIADYTKATEIPSTAQERLLALNNRSHAYFDQGNYTQALADANAVLGSDAFMVEARINRANATVKLGNNDPKAYEAALNDYNYAIREAGRGKLDKRLLAGAYTDRGNVRFLQRLPDKAIVDYNLALRTVPNYVDALYNRGLAYADQRNVALAQKDLTQAADLYGQQRNRTMQASAAEAAKVLQKSPTSTPQ